MKAKILYSLLFAIAMTLVATADYSGNKRVADSAAPVMLTRTQQFPAPQDVHHAYMHTQYIPDSTALVLR